MSPISASESSGSLAWVRELSATTAEGKRYERPAAVQAEIGRVLALDQCEWRHSARQLQEETLVYLIRRLGRGEDELRGALLELVSKRIGRLARRWIHGIDPVAAEEMILQVDMEILELVLTEVPSRQSDFVEISFSQAVVRRILNRVRDYNKSPMNRRNENATLARDDDGESETPLEQLADEGDSPEGIVLALQDKAHRRELFREALRVVKGKRAKQIVVLYFIHDWPIECNDGSKPDLVHRFNATPREIQYVLAKSMRAMRATLRKGR